MKKQEIKRRVRVGTAVTFSHIAYPKSYSEEDWFPDCYLQIAQTLGLKTKYGHPELETLVTFSMEGLGYSVLKQLITAVENGERFSGGDRTRVTGSFYRTKDVTVEFRNSENCYGPCLRAVVLGLEEEFQNMSSDEASEYLHALSPLIDPCDYV